MSYWAVVLHGRSLMRCCSAREAYLPFACPEKAGFAQVFASERCAARVGICWVVELTRRSCAGHLCRQATRSQLACALCERRRCCRPRLRFRPHRNRSLQRCSCQRGSAWSLRGCVARVATCACAHVQVLQVPTEFTMQLHPRYRCCGSFGLAAQALNARFVSNVRPTFRPSTSAQPAVVDSHVGERCWSQRSLCLLCF